MKKQHLSIIFILLLLAAGSGTSFGQSDIFSYGSIPFGQGLGWVGERTEEVINRADSPDATFLAHRAIIRRANTEVARFFEGGIAAPNVPGSAYVWLNGEYASKYVVGLSGRPRTELFFFSRPDSTAGERLFIVHKQIRLNGRYGAVYDGIEESIRGRIGFAPVTYDGSFYGGAVDTYSVLGFWPGDDVTVLLQARESRPQSETSVVDYIYIDTRLWREYSRAVSGESRSESGSVGGAMESF